MVKKHPKGGNFFFLFFIISFTFSLSPYGKKQNHLLFSPFFITGNRKTARENVLLKKFFFFFWLFSTLPLIVIRKITTYLFFRNSDLKCPKMPLSALKFHFLQITFFSAVITRTHHLPTHTPFFRPLMSKKRALPLFFKITFLCSLLLLLNPETLSNHFFRQTNH